MKYNYYGFLDGNIKNKRGMYVGFGTAKEAYAFLIDKTCGRGTWHSNTYVFVYDFELVKQ